jgi:hypothetical protein
VVSPHVVKISTKFRSTRYMSDFKGRRFPTDLILLCVRWYCKFGISYRDLEEMTSERGVQSHDSVPLGSTLCAAGGKARPLVSAPKDEPDKGPPAHCGRDRGAGGDHDADRKDFVVVFCHRHGQTHLSKILRKVSARAFALCRFLLRATVMARVASSRATSWSINSSNCASVKCMKN